MPGKDQPNLLFNPRRLSICVQDGDGMIHTLRPEAPAVFPWATCRTDLDDEARFVLKVEPMIFAGLNGERLESPRLCLECLPSSDAQRAETLGERLQLFTCMAGKEEYEELRKHIDAGTHPDSREGRLGAIAVTLEALGRLRAYVESGAYDQEKYEAVVEELRNGPAERSEQSEDLCVPDVKH